MEKEGVVSLWLGNTKSTEFLNDYVDLKYTEDGEWESSEFFNDFNIDIDDVEEDFIEKVRYNEKGNDLGCLLSGCSYEESLIRNIKDIVREALSKNFNTVILIYDFEYLDEKITISNDIYDMKYICSVGYTV